MKILIVFLSLFFLIACNQEPSKPAKPLTGAQIYKVRCQTCHGGDGRLGLNGARSLPESPLNIEERIKVVTEGRNGIMPAFGEMISKEQIQKVAEYTMLLK
jgi:cytochrome c6